MERTHKFVDAFAESNNYSVNDRELLTRFLNLSITPESIQGKENNMDLSLPYMADYLKAQYYHSIRQEQSSPQTISERLITDVTQGKLKIDNPNTDGHIKTIMHGKNMYLDSKIYLNPDRTPTSQYEEIKGHKGFSTFMEEKAKKASLDYVQTASDYLKVDEGYSEEKGMYANKPSERSGLTVAGLDYTHGGAEVKKIIREELGNGIADALDNISKLTTNEEVENGLSAIGFKLSNSQIASLQTKYVKKNVEPIMKAEDRVGSKAWERMPETIKQPLLALSFLNKGKTSAVALKEWLLDPLNKAKYNKAYSEYDKYWADDVSTDHKNARAHRVRDAIEQYYKDIIGE